MSRLDFPLNQVHFSEFPWSRVQSDHVKSQKMRNNTEPSRPTLIYPQRKSEEEENKEQFYQVKPSKCQMFPDYCSMFFIQNTYC